VPHSGPLAVDDVLPAGRRKRRGRAERRDHPARRTSAADERRSSGLDSDWGGRNRRGADNTLSTGFYTFATEAPGTYRVEAKLATGDGYALTGWTLYDDASYSQEVVH
jgi:hypothetical protein